MQKVRILDEDGNPVLDKRKREKFCYSLDANEAIRQGAYVVAESHEDVLKRTGKKFTVITAVRPKTDADRKKDARAKKKAAEKALADAEATLASEEVLGLEPKAEEPPVTFTSLNAKAEVPDELKEDIPADEEFGGPSESTTGSPIEAPKGKTVKTKPSRSSSRKK